MTRSLEHKVPIEIRHPSYEINLKASIQRSYSCFFIEWHFNPLVPLGVQLSKDESQEESILTSPEAVQGF